MTQVPRRERRSHSDDEMLAAVRDLLLEHGSRGVTTAAISERSGAPTGSLYHRFGSRANMVAELWIRTIRKFHVELFVATDSAEPGMKRAMAGVNAIVDFCSKNQPDARLMLVASVTELENDPSLPADLAESLRTLNEPVEALVGQLTRELYGRISRAGLDRVSIGVMGLPYTAVRRCLLQDRDPAQVRVLVEQAARAVLAAH
jgi:AcrR family transcriptional regulator